MLALQGGRPEMDSKQFVKLCRESGVLGEGLTTTSADLAFVAKAKPLVRALCAPSSARHDVCDMC